METLLKLLENIKYNKLTLIDCENNPIITHDITGYFEKKVVEYYQNEVTGDLHVIIDVCNYMEG